MTWWPKLRDKMARLLIRFNQFKPLRLDEDRLNDMLVDSLPHQALLDVPGGQATLALLTAQISIGHNNRQGVDITLLCGLDISCMKQQLYRAHLDVCVNALPYFHQPDLSIRVKNPRISALKLINDEYLLINSGQSLIKSMTPAMFKGLVDVTLGSAMGVINGVLPPPVKDYLAVFNAANKQHILDFHRPQLEQQLLQMIERGDFKYPLQASGLAEKLFADLGQSIEIENHQLVFRF